MPAPQLRAVVTASEPDTSRERLRDAIARVATAQDAVTRVEQGRDHVHSAYLAALRSLDTAKDRLSAAEADGHKHRVATLLGEATGAQPTSEMRRAVELAEIAAASAKEDEALLDDEIKRRRATLSFAVSARDVAVSDALRPAAVALLQRLHDLSAQVAAIRGALHCLPSDCLENYWDSAREFPEDIALNSRWRDTVEALSTDADAPIPEI